MMQGILRLHAKNDRNAKRLGRFLVFQYRIRANQRSWSQPYRVADLLSGAGVSIDRKNPGRFRERIESALNVLANPGYMEGPICVKSWRYRDQVDPGSRGWFDRWLEARIVILPPDEIAHERYPVIAPKGRAPGKLAAGSKKAG
jgi:hypothetical protein